MSKLNIIQRRELEPLMLKASRIVKDYEKAVNCGTSVMGPDLNYTYFDLLCSRCTNKKCMELHMETTIGCMTHFSTTVMQRSFLGPSTL